MRKEAQWWNCQSGIVGGREKKGRFGILMSFQQIRALVAMMTGLRTTPSPEWDDGGCRMWGSFNTRFESFCTNLNAMKMILCLNSAFYSVQILTDGEIKFQMRFSFWISSLSSFKAEVAQKRFELVLEKPFSDQVGVKREVCCECRIRAALLFRWCPLHPEHTVFNRHQAWNRHQLGTTAVRKLSRPTGAPRVV